MSTERLSSDKNLGQFLKDLPADHPEKKFLKRIGRQFGFDLTIAETEQELILNDGDLGRPEIFRRLTKENGMPSTHGSHYLLGPKALHWEGKRPSRRRRY